MSCSSGVCDATACEMVAVRMDSRRVPAIHRRTRKTLSMSVEITDVRSRRQFNAAPKVTFMVVVAGSRRSVLSWEPTLKRPRIPTSRLRERMAAIHTFVHMVVSAQKFAEPSRSIRPLAFTTVQPLVCQVVLPPGRSGQAGSRRVGFVYLWERTLSSHGGRPFYTPFLKPAPPRGARPGEHQWTVAKDGRLITCEFRDEGEYGSEAQLLCDGEWYAGRRFGDRAHAVAHSDAVRARLARDGWTVTTQM